MPPEIPNDLIPADLVPVDTGIPADLVPADQGMELSVSEALAQPTPQLPTFQMPQSLPTGQRSLEAVTSGLLGLTKPLTQAVDVATGMLPATQNIQDLLTQAQLQAGQVPQAPATGEQLVSQTLGTVPGIGETLQKGFEFQAQTAPEAILELTAGIAPGLAAEAAIAPKKVVSEAKAAVEQLQAYTDAKNVLGVKHGIITPEPITPSAQTLSTASSDTATAGQRYQQAYSKQLQKPVVFGAEQTKAAKDLDRKLTRLNSVISENQSIINNSNEPEIVAKAQDRLRRANAAQNKLNNESAAIFESPAYKALKESKAALEDQTIVIAGKEIPVYKKSLSPQGVYVSPQEIEAQQNAGSINAFTPVITDMQRIWEGLDGNVPNGPLFQLNFQPAVDAEVAAANAVTRETNALRQTVMDLGINKLPAKRQEQLFDVMDGTLDRTAANLTENENKFINYAAEKYSEWLQKINGVRVKLGYDPVKARKDYITHIRELNFFDSFGLGAQTPDMSAAVNKFPKKLRERFAFEQERLGGKFKKDPIGAIEAYIRPAMGQIYKTEPAAVLQARANFISDPVLRNTQTRWINTRFLGGIDTKDRALYELGLKPALDLATAWTQRFSSSVIGGNLKVSLEQFSQVGNTFKDQGFMPTLVGLARGAQKIPAEIADKSSFLQLRKLSDDLVELPKGWLYTPQKFLRAFFDYTDRYVARASWHAGFARAQELGMDLDAAIKYADNAGRMLHGNYSNLYKPELISGRVGKVAAPLQTFGFNLWNYLMRDTKLLAKMENTSNAREMLKTFATMYATNQFYDSMGLPQPFGIRIPQAATPEEAAVSAKQFVTQTVPLGRALEFGTPSPFVNTLVTEFREPEKSVIRNSILAFSSDDEQQKEESAKILKRFGSQFVPGGTQLLKTIDGIEARKNGYVTYGKKTVVLDEKDRRLAPILGPYNTPTIRKLREEKELEKARQYFQGKK